MKKSKAVIVGLLVAIQSYGAMPFVLSFKTTDIGDNRNTLVGYVTTSAGAYVDTFGVYGSRDKYIGELTGWRSTSGITSFSNVAADAKMGATRSNFSTPSPVVFSWDLKNSAGNDIPDGTYTIHLANAHDGSDRYGTFSFIKDDNAGTRTVANFANFTALSMVYDPPPPAPEWIKDPITGSVASVGRAYSDTLGNQAWDPEDLQLTFSKVAGPNWLIVSPFGGALSGTPTHGDAGLNTFTVEVDNGNGGTARATLNIVVKIPVTDLIIKPPTAEGFIMRLSWTGAAEQTYSVETNLNLSSENWNSWTSGIIGAGATILVTPPVTEDQLYYRVITE